MVDNTAVYHAPEYVRGIINLRGKIVTALDTWPCFSNPALEKPYESSWCPVFRGAELLMLLSVGEERKRSERYEQLKGWLDQHMANGYGPSGLSLMGVEATAQAGGFLIPAVYACRSIGDHSLDQRFDTLAMAWWRLAMATASFSADHATLGSGVYQESIYRGGWHSPRRQRPRCC